MKLENKEKKQSKNMPLKKAKTGLEVEMHIIDLKGRLSYKCMDLIKNMNLDFPDIEIMKECGRNMIEFGCYPDVSTYNPAFEMIESIQTTIKSAKMMGLKLYPFATYPGKTNSKFTPDESGKYKVQEIIFGKEKFSLATKAVGFHHHYALPKGVFDNDKKELKLLIDSKLKRSLLNSYNFEIAIDPILTVLTQSSPFFEGELLAKDSRMLIYRGGRKLGYDGLYNKYQQIGALPPYKQTETDLIRSLKRRQITWKHLIKKADKHVEFRKLYPNILDISWNPVKINKHGTIEERGMDMNFMSILLGVSALIKFCLKKIQREFIEVIPADLGMVDAFKIRKGIMFIPPHTYVRENLQKASAYEGLSNDELYEYTKKFFKFAKSLTPAFYYPILKRIEGIIEKRRTVSDEMIAFAKRNKMLDKKRRISNKDARKFALYYSNEFEKDLIKTKKIVSKIMQDHKNLLR